MAARRLSALARMAEGGGALWFGGFDWLLWSKKLAAVKLSVQSLYGVVPAAGGLVVRK
jgi:hypothetical protein